MLQRRLLSGLLLLGLTVTACTDLVGPSAESDADYRGRSPIHPSPEIAAIFEAAEHVAPIDASEGVGIGIPEETRESTSAEVIFYNPRLLERHRFEKRDGDWASVEVLERRALDPTDGSISVGLNSLSDILPRGRSLDSQSPPVHYDGYSSSIATLYNQAGNVRDNDWFIPDKTSTGWYSYSEEYATDLPYSATFHEGTDVDADTTYEARFSDLSGNSGLWEAFRINDPGAGDNKSCQNLTCDVSFEYVDENNDPFTVGAEKVKATFYLYVQRPVTVDAIDGPTSISGVGGTETWTASASGGDGLGFDYVWEQSFDDGSTWTQVGTGSTWSYTFSSSDSNKSFHLRVTATSGTESGQKEIFVDVGEISDPLDVDILGPTHIETTGTYTWDASVSGGTPPYHSYEWKYCETSCTVVSTTTSYSRYVQVGDPDFKLYLTVSDSGTGELAQTETTGIDVYVYKGGGVLSIGN